MEWTRKAVTATELGPRLGGFLFLLVVGLHSLVAWGQEPVDFAHDVMPILRSRCGECHADGQSQGGFSLETRENLIESGMAAPGSHIESELFERITSEDPDVRMPPEGEPLTRDEIGTLARWIDAGLDWPAELPLRTNRFQRPLELDPTVLDAVRSAGRHPVDFLLDRYFADHGVEAPPLLDDRAFLRRLKLDLVGQLPSTTELEEFTTDSNSDKYAQWVDRFLAQDRDYADHWLTFWNDLLRNDYAGTGYIDGGREQITAWLYQALRENRPYDQFVRELIDPVPGSGGFAKGIKWRGQVNASQIEPLQFSQNVSQVFFGANLKCASCHDSFIDNWKLSDAYGLAAVISDQPLEIHRCDVPTGETARASFLFPELGEIDPDQTREQRLQTLSALATDRRNGRFARTIVNRLWDRLAGRGIVHPVDVMANEGWCEPLLEFLAADLVENGYDLKRTLRWIATSRVYRGQPTPAIESPPADWVFRGVQTKRLTAEQFVDAVWALTGAGPDQIEAPITVEISEEQPVRASLVTADLLMRSLGRPNREQVVTTRPATLSTLQALDLTNGETLANWLKTGAHNWRARQQAAGWNDGQLVDQLFLAALGRLPNEDEKAALASPVPTDSEALVEDLLWMLLMLPEFQYTP